MEILNDFRDDQVSAVLADVRVSSTVFCLSELGSPWGFQVSGRNVATFHLVLEGGAQLEVGDAAILLRTGDLVLLPHGHEHTMRDQADSPAVGLETILDDHPMDDNLRLFYGGPGPRCRLLCGGFTLEALPPLVRPLLPQVMHVDAGASHIPVWLDALFGLLQAEADTPKQGSKAMFAKLADVFLSQAIRTFLVGVEDSGLASMAPANDAVISRALLAMHSDPVASWSVPGLAAEVGLSRSAFNDRFVAATGSTPIRYLTSVRLGLAAGYLTTTNKSLFTIAQDVGYDTDESFSKAFKRAHGITPGDYRHRARRHPLLVATPQTV